MLTDDDLEFLDEQRIGRLATADRAGRPQVVPVCFARIGTHLYIPIDAKPKAGDPRALRRLRNLRERPDATLLVDRYDEDWSRLRWLMVRAGASVFEEGHERTAAERTAALQALERRYPQYAGMALSTLGLPVIALKPATVRRWRATPPGETERSLQ